MEGGANVATITITFSWACTHVYKNQLHDMATSNCVLCGSNLPSCRERRVLYSRESCHVVSTAVDLLVLRKCVPHGCATNLESSFFMSTTLGTSYICKRPRFSSLERIQKLEREAEELRNSFMEKLKVTHRAELRKRRETAESTVNFLDDTVERTAQSKSTTHKVKHYWQQRITQRLAISGWQGHEHVVPCHYLFNHTALLTFHLSISRSLYNSTVDVHLYIDLPQNLIIDVIIEHSSTPECWRTVPNELKPSHQALLLGYNFRPTPRYAHYDLLLGPGDEARNYHES